MTKILTGTVISTKMQNTITVLVERKFRHRVYGKVMKVHKKYKVHNENKGIKDGDRVAIKETKPISKEKHFIVIDNKK
jgi:small subunit ribosomal protein S17